VKLQPLLAAFLAGFILGTAARASAETPIPVGHFRTIELQGGGRIILRHAPIQRVSIAEGNAQVSDIHLSSDRGGAGPDRQEPHRLIVDACRDRCPPNYHLVVEIDSPNVDALAVRGGGEIEVANGFPRMGNLAAAVEGGGRLDARALAASNIAAAVDGGGDLLVGPSDALAAAISGGGRILYRGHPQIATNIEGGGRVERAEP
jgi:hypothetical protein